MSGPRKAPIALAPVPANMPRLMARRDRWRDRLNPLRGLSIQNVITWLDMYQAGVTANLEWIYQKIEGFDADMIGLIDSTNSALVQLNWHVKTVDGDVRRAQQWDKVLATEQQNALYEFYNGIANLSGTLEALAMAKYRGYAHVQISAENQWLKEFEPLDQWNVCRDGYKGDWFWNPDARQTYANSLPPENLLDERCYLILDTMRPIDAIAVLKYLRAMLSQKDWDAFVEIYGIPSWIIEMPANVPAGKDQEYANLAAEVAAGGSGALPNGSKAYSASYPNGEPPFRAHLDYWSEKLVLAGTGGLLTSLSMPQGIGRGATDAHQETFSRIARARAKMISEEFQKKIDAAILAQRFQGRPTLAYFEFDSQETLDPGQVADHFVKIKQAGFQGDPQQFQDRTGYRVTISTTPEPVIDVNSGGDALRSRSPARPRLASSSHPDTASTDNALAATATKAFAEATRLGFRPLAEALWPLLDIEDPRVLTAAMDAVLKQFPDMAKQVLASDASAKVLTDTNAAAAVNGLAAVAKKARKRGAK